jgi:hypothetical protein
MLTLPLITPDVSEVLAVHYLDRGAPSAVYHAVDRSGAWQAGAGSGSAGDVLAWALVAFLLLTLGVIAGCIFARSRPAGPTPEQQLIEEVQRNEDALAQGITPSAEGASQSWERDADWWRKDG